MGLMSRGYQENNRAEYVLDGVQVCIDEWPKIPPYVEFEGNDSSSVVSAAAKLGFEKEELTGKNTREIYNSYGIDLDQIPILKF